VALKRGVKRLRRITRSQAAKAVSSISPDARAIVIANLSACGTTTRQPQSNEKDRQAT